MKNMPINAFNATSNQTLLPRSAAIDALALTEAAALACFHWIGKGKEKDADQAAVSAMRECFSNTELNGTIIIGEGERDEAPMLYIGEKVGKASSSICVDIAVDPLEGTTLCALAMPNSISVMAIAPQGTLLHAPDVYMEKIAVGISLPEGVIDLDNTPVQNLRNLAKVKKCEVSDLRVCLLNRPRHEKLIADIRATGAKVQLITDGDVTAAIATCLSETHIDMYIGTGGAPEGVLAAAALKCMGGFMQGRLVYKDDGERQRARKLGIKDENCKYAINDMVSSDALFAATGVTDGWLLHGVKANKQAATFSSHSLLMHAADHSIQFIQKTSRLG